MLKLVTRFASLFASLKKKVKIVSVTKRNKRMIIFTYSFYSIIFIIIIIVNINNISY